MEQFNRLKGLWHSRRDFLNMTGLLLNTEIMGFEVDLKPEGRMLFIKNHDIPGVIGKIGTILGEMNINISGYLLSKVEDKDFVDSFSNV